MPDTTNPYDEFLANVGSAPIGIQTFCKTQREDLARESKAKFLDQSFQGVQPDEILVNLLNDVNYKDPRNNLVIWARLPPAVMDMASRCQKQLQDLELGKIFERCLGKPYCRLGHDTLVT